MKKIIKTGVVLALAAVLVVAGVFAAQTLDFDTTATVSFSSESAYVDIQGDVYITNDLEDTFEDAAAAGTRTYTQSTYNTTSTAPLSAMAADWAIGDLEFTEAAGHIVLLMTFHNAGESTVRITLSAPIAIDNTTLSKYQSTAAAPATGDETLHVKNLTTAMTGTTIDLASGNSITVTYVLSLDDYRISIPEVDDNFSFNVEMTTDLPA